VAWVPLAPGEIYYGRGYYGPHSVNIINININQVRITDVYKNVYVNNGVTVVSRNTFATATPKIVRMNENIIRQRVFVKNNISVGAPVIKPTKASYFMSAKRVPSSKLPPKHIVALRVKELRKSRPFMKERNQSVLNPGVKPRQLPLKTVSKSKTRGKGRPMIQPVRPAEKGKPGVRERRPVLQEEKRITIPEKQLAPEGRPATKEKKRITPPEERIVVPESRPERRPERHIKPVEKPAPGGQQVTKEKKKREGSKKGEKEKTEEPERVR
jgi:hypothetical protein